MPLETTPFERRVRKIEQRHLELRKGAVTVTRPDGLMVLRPRQRRGRRLVPAVIAVCALFIGLKSFVYITEGAITYEARIERLTLGTVPVSYAAKVMQMDPATRFMIDQFNAIMAQRL